MCDIGYKLINSFNSASILRPHLSGVIRSPDLQRQIQLLQENPPVDYVLWGYEDRPDVPYAVIFMEPIHAHTFILHRRRIFYQGKDADALAYITIMLEQVILRKKISKTSLHAQLRREFGEKYFNEVVSSITSANKYHRKLDGKVYAVEDIPFFMPNGDQTQRQLKAAGRFPEHLEHIQ